MLIMCSLSVNALVGDTFGYRAESLLMIGLDRKSEQVMPFVDVKSEGLRDILREVLHDIKAVCLMEDKPSVIETDIHLKENADLRLDRAKHAISFLPELEKYAKTMNNDPDRGSAQLKDLRLLIDHLKHTYMATSQRLDSMLQHGHITYDLVLRASRSNLKKEKLSTANKKDIHRARSL
jgi:hypothetical protein